MSVKTSFTRYGNWNVNKDACRHATRTTPGVAEDVAFIGRVVDLTILMYQMSRDTIPDHT
jgi:hypothetical protein